MRIARLDAKSKLFFGKQIIFLIRQRTDMGDFRPNGRYFHNRRRFIRLR